MLICSNYPPPGMVQGGTWGMVVHAMCGIWYIRYIGACTYVVYDMCDMWYMGGVYVRCVVLHITYGVISHMVCAYHYLCDV